ncbi:hypothetical protein [Oceanospirillum phage vB_OsaM_PD0307]|nr:hypothetical protein [Oceanospirillum phage vB_OsaM_PD0307]
MNKIKRAAAGLLILAAFGLVGQMDYEDEVAQHAHCLDMVERGVWPAEVCEP